MFSSFKSVRSVVDKAEIALAKGEINLALRVAHDFVERIITEPICTAQVFASRDLDQLCIAIGRKNLSHLKETPKYPIPAGIKRPTVIYIVSRLQKSGGHSRLIQDFIHAQPEKNHLILSTEIGGPSDKRHFSEIFATRANASLVFSPRGNFAVRLDWLQSMLVNIKPEHIHLFNHHQDSVAAAALVPELGLEGSFYHHGDHHLCLGVHLEHLAHVDLHPMGYHYCRDQLGIDNIYLPLTFQDKGCVPLQTEFMLGGSLTTATAARANKVEIPYYVSYLDTIPKVLKVTGGRHIHIGRLTPWGLRRIYKQLKKNEIPFERFVYLEWAPSVWESLQKYQVDIYIASFPYGAGLTLIEAMGAGVPVIMHRHMYSRVLSGLELAYPEAFSWASQEDLLKHLAELQPDQIKVEQSLARLRYEEYHRPKILKDYLADSKSLRLPPVDLCSGFSTQADEWAAWVECQINLPRFMYQKVYRAMRKQRLSF